LQLAGSQFVVSLSEDEACAIVLAGLKARNCQKYQFPLGKDALEEVFAQQIEQVLGKPIFIGIRGPKALLHRRPADSLRLKSDGYLDTVGDPDEGNAAVHPVVFTVKGYCPFDLTHAFALAVGR
jgi:hypothetical protein